MLKTYRSTVADEIRFGPENLDRSDIERHVDDAIDRLTLEAVRDADTYELGRPVRKRVALASVLAMDTPVVVLDEPTGGQDVTGVEIIGEVIENLVAEGRLVVCITHDVEFASTHADRVVVLSDGSVVADGSPKAVFTDEEMLTETGLRPPVPIEIANTLDLSGCLNVEDLLAQVA